MATASRYGLGGYGRGKPINRDFQSIPGKMAFEDPNAEDEDFMEFQDKTTRSNLGFHGSRIEVEAQKLTRRGMFGRFDKVRIIDSYQSDFFATISYMENPNYFCVQSRTMMKWVRKNEDKLHIEIETKKEELKLDPEVNYTNMACAVLSNGKWRRGYIMRTNWGKWPDSAHDYIAEINLVDSGHYGFERMTNLRELPDEWMKTPPMAYRAMLDGSSIYARGDDWPSKIIKEFRGLFKEGMFIASFCGWNNGAAELKMFPDGHWCDYCVKNGEKCSANDVIDRMLTSLGLS